MLTDKAAAGSKDNDPSEAHGHHTPEGDRFILNPHGTGVATSGASLGAACASAGALPGASPMSRESPSYRPVSDTTLGAIRAQQFLSSTGAHLAPAAASGSMTDATTLLESQLRQASGDRLSSLGATTVQDALFAALPSAATGASTPYAVGSMVSQQRDQARVIVARADEVARNDADAASTQSQCSPVTQPRCSLDAASMQPLCSLVMPPRGSLVMQPFVAASMQPVDAALGCSLGMQPCDATSTQSQCSLVMQPQCSLVMQPRCSLNAASMQP